MTTAQAPGGGLVVCPTPIGNLGDVTLRVLEALKRADLIACEDTRHTRTLLERHGITSPLISFHEHNEAARAPELLERIRAGALIALVSDAGTPLVSDPGFQLLRACLSAGVSVEVLPGPSAVLTALIASGLPAAGFTFSGFLPRRASELEELVRGNAQTLIAFESPRRLAGTLEVIARVDPERPCAVCRELTKVHEEVRRGSARELSAHYQAPRQGEGPLRGEIVLVLGGAPARDGREREALGALRELIDAGARTRAAARVVAELTGTRANRLYAELTAAEHLPGGPA